MTRASILLLLVAVGATMAYVSPDDQTRSNTGSGYRGAADISASAPAQAQRLRPKPLSASDVYQLEQAKRGARGTGARRAREIDTSYHSASVGGAGAYASSGAGSFAGTNGQYQPGGGQGNNAGAAFGAGFGPMFGFQGNPFQNQQPGNNFAPFDFNSFFQQLQQIQQSIGQYGLNQAGGNAGFGGGNDAGVAYNQIGNNFEGAAASASLGPNGGYGSANLIPDLGNRFGAQSGQFDPPTGGNVGVFTSSSSGTSDVNGQRQTFKTATSGVNDNGKITTFTVRDPPQ